MIVEIVGCSVSDCQAIERAGAHRIELCSGILAGGVTPSLGLYRACKAATSLPLMVMVRPREGGFFYNASEFDTMTRDVDILGEAGADGVVFGILRPDGQIDGPRMADLRRRAGSMKVMCHRAFDVTPDPFTAIEVLVDAGVDRVLSSGQTTSILAGLPLLTKLIAHASGRIQVQPCEGIRPENARQVVEATRPASIHLGPFQSRTDPTSGLDREVCYGDHLTVDETCVREVVQITQSSNA